VQRGRTYTVTFDMNGPNGVIVNRRLTVRAAS
jgi:hypothetical protein